ncbi:MAG: zinc-finger domain-containing protein [Rickettsiales bacterium]|nr:MAG: zinc-finger domain-containing protein [Rickettsiales bacterium]
MENTKTNLTSVSCKGKEYPYDHPIIYLEIDKAVGEVICPYCSKKFTLNN